MRKNWLKLIIVVAAAAYFFQCGLHAGDWHFLDAVDLVIHEAGHVVFMPFGFTLYVAGGSLMQILVPAVFAMYFFRRQDFFSGGLLLFWLAQNFWSVAVYAGDAVTMQLPLITGDKSTHDWNVLLTQYDLLHHTAAIAAFIAGLGWLAWLVGLIISAWAALAHREETIIMQQ